MAKRTVDMDLVKDIAALVDRVGVYDLVLALAAVAHSKGLTSLADKSPQAPDWEAVAQSLKRFARVRLQGLR